MNVVRAIAGIFALTGFAVSCLGAMRGGASASDALWTALLVMTGCFIVGWCAGWVIRRTIDEHVVLHTQRRARAASQNDSSSGS